MLSAVHARRSRGLEAENGQSGILLMPVKRMRHPDRVDRMGQGWQGSTWPPAAGAAAKQTGVTEVVLKGVTKEADGRSREVVLFTDKSGCQTVRMRFKTTGEEEQPGMKG